MHTTSEIWREFFLFLLGPMAGAMSAMFVAKFLITEPIRKAVGRLHWGFRYLLECVMCIYGWPALFITFFYEPAFLRWVFYFQWDVFGINVLWIFGKSFSLMALWYLGGLWYKYLFPFVERNAPKRRISYGKEPLLKRNAIHPTIYDFVVIGGGIVGTAAAYILSWFMRGLASVLLIEKNPGLALVNSNTAANAQNAHGGDIETNFGFKKMLTMRDGEFFLTSFLEKFANGGKRVFRRMWKMALGVRASEVEVIRSRYANISEYYPTLRLLRREEIANIAPKLLEGRNPNIPVAALWRPNGYAVDYHKATECLAEEAGKSGKLEILLNTKTRRVVPKDGFYEIRTNRGIYRARNVVVAAGPRSLLFAHDLGYAGDLTILPVAGNFWRTSAVNFEGKVYPVQDPDLPFARLHIDQDVNNPKEMRIGPTIEIIPFLEKGHWRTFIDFLRTGIISWRGERAFVKIIFRKTDGRRKILRLALRNACYKIPIIGKWFVLKSIRETVPTLNYGDIRLAEGEGGIRPQLVNLKTGELEMGVGKIPGENIIFDITPSPGASDSVRNALVNAAYLAKSSGGKYELDLDAFEKEYPGSYDALNRVMKAADELLEEYNKSNTTSDV